MKHALSAAAALSLAALAGCSETTSSGPWLTAPNASSHAAYLPLTGTAHELDALLADGTRMSCDKCHPATAASFKRTYRDAAGNTQYGVNCSTSTCHDPGSATYGTTIHGLMPDYQALLAQVPRPLDFCLHCHPQGTAGITDAAHHGFFPVGPGTKHNRSCTACHGPLPTPRNDITRLQCAACHQALVDMTAKHALVSDYPAVPVPKDCLRCHDSGQVDRLAAHGARQPTVPGYGRAGPWDSDAALCAGGSSDKHGCPNRPSRCFTCHDGLPPLYGGTGAGLDRRPWAQDWKIPATTANQAAAGACRGCHGPQ